MATITGDNSSFKIKLGKLTLDLNLKFNEFAKLKNEIIQFVNASEKDATIVGRISLNPYIDITSNWIVEFTLNEYDNGSYECTKDEVMQIFNYLLGN